MRLKLTPLLILLLPTLPTAAAVDAREVNVTLPTWEIGPPQVHSVFYDGSRRSGSKAVYPYTLNEVLTDRKSDRTYRAVVLENEYIQIMVLPEIGGRLHGALDKTNGYTWLYWQKTIKPGLIAMTGAWISGGIEWNFPHGHRPSCFMPVDHRLVHHADGSATVWVGETEPIYRIRWLVGMTVFPGRSHVRCDYVLINPTDRRQPYQFWATAATHANEHTQAQYPGDVVTGHGKQQFWNWPVDHGVDLTWWKNSFNSASYFAFNNPSPWFGTYDHRAQGGMVHVADPHTMPGKKLWTWGSGPSGRIWEDILTEGGGPYFEPQAGGWSDNQPDYHWMHPHEVKTTHDVWYPVRDIRGYHNASEDFAVNTDLKDGRAFGGVYATAVAKDHRIVLRDAARNRVLSDKVVTLSPDRPFTVEAGVPNGTTIHDLALSVHDATGKLRIETRQTPPRQVNLPPGKPEPAKPQELKPDELYHAGEWLERFIRPGEAAAYHQEALQRDPGDSRVNAELGTAALSEGRWDEALARFTTALARDGDSARLHFGRALALAGLRREDEACDAFHRASWGYDYFAQAMLNVARLDLRRGDARAALKHVQEAERQNGRFADIPALQAAAHRLAQQPGLALAAAERALDRDALHFQGGFEKLLALRMLGRNDTAAWEKTWRGVMRDEPQNFLELATVYGNAGCWADADNVLALSPVHPMASYLRGYYRELAGDAPAAAQFYRAAANGRLDYVNPHRLEELAALEAALHFDPRDAHAHLLAGNLLYAKARREEGFAHWQKAVAIDPKLTLARRNVAYARRFLNKDLRASHAAYLAVLAQAPADARILLETDQVAEQLKLPVTERLALLERHSETVAQRDDLVGRRIELRLKTGDTANLERALHDLQTRHFHSWEGRYGIHLIWVELNQRLGDLAFDRREYDGALRYYTAAGDYPKNLEVAPRTPDFRAHVNWNLARVHLATGSKDRAEVYLEKILAEKYRTAHLGTFFHALARKARGDLSGYRELRRELETRAHGLAAGEVRARDGRPIGHYLLSRLAAERGDTAAAQQHLHDALTLDPEAGQLAIREAQLDYSRAHQ